MRSPAHGGGRLQARGGDRRPVGSILRGGLPGKCHHSLRGCFVPRWAPPIKSHSDLMAGKRPVGQSAGGQAGRPRASHVQTVRGCEACRLRVTASVPRGSFSPARSCSSPAPAPCPTHIPAGISLISYIFHYCLSEKATKTSPKPSLAVARPRAVTGDRAAGHSGTVPSRSRRCSGRDRLNQSTRTRRPGQENGVEENEGGGGRTGTLACEGPARLLWVGRSS